MSNGAERVPLLRGIGSAARTSGAAWTTGDIGNLDGDHRSGAEMGRFRGRTPNLWSHSEIPRAVSLAVSFSRHSVDLRVRCYDTDAQDRKSTRLNSSHLVIS